MLRGELSGLTLTDLWRGNARIELVCWKHGELNFSRDTLKAAMGRLGRYFPVSDLVNQGVCDGCGQLGTVSIRDVRRKVRAGASVLGDPLPADCRVEVICNVPSCGESSYLDMKALSEKYGPDMSMDRVRAMLRCKGCGTKGKAQTIIRLPDPTDLMDRALAMMELSERRRIEQPPKRKHHERED